MANAGVVNIRRDVDDKFYRYRMPVLLTKIEGKGNGIKTVVPNMSDVARALSRPPTYPTKFFGCELGAQTTFDEKSDRYIVNGAHDATRLRELLDTFIDKFVLCAECKNPETDLIINKQDMIIRDCKACGKRTNVDMRHKLTTFILKNPPKISKKKKAKDGNATAETGAGTPPEEDGDAASDDELTKRIKSEAAELNASTQLNEWSADTSPEAVKARQAQESGVPTKLLAGMGLGDDDSDEDANSPYSLLGEWATANRSTTTAVEVFKHAQELGIDKKHKTVQVLVQALFTENIIKDKEIDKFAPLFVKMIISEKDPSQKSERHQKSLLGGIERFLGTTHPDLIPQIPQVLMAFYQADALDEELLQSWGTHVSGKYVSKDTSKKVRRAAAPFLKWLEEAEDDDESEEEEDDE